LPEFGKFFMFGVSDLVFSYRELATGWLVLPQSVTAA
jgi:hypothetical protein